MENSWKECGFWLSAVLLFLPCQSLAAQPSEQIISENRMIEPGRPLQIDRSFHVDWGEKGVLSKVTLRDWSGPNGTPIQHMPTVNVNPVAENPGVSRVDVILRDVTEPGLYMGKILLTRESKESQQETKTFTIRLIASFKPTISVLPARDLSLKVSNCFDGLGHCGATYLFAPESSSKEYTVNVKNTSPAPIDITVEYWATGVTPPGPVLLFKGGADQKTAMAPLELTNIRPGDSRHIIAMVPNADQLSAAIYNGSLQISARPTPIAFTDPQFTADKSNDGSYFIKNLTTAEVGTAVSVRVGVFWPFIAVVFGICAGRVAATLATQGFQTKLDFYPRFIDLQAGIGRLPIRFKRVLEELLDGVWRTVLKGMPEETIEPLFVNLERHYAYVRQLEELNGVLARMMDEPVRNAAIANTQNALDQLATRNPDLKNAQEIRDTVLKVLDDMKTRLPAQSGLESIAATGREWHSQDLVLSKPSSKKLARYLNALAGTGTQGVGLYYTWMRPAMHLIVLSVLAIQGIWQQYVAGAEAASFGSQGISQYAILFLWGVSSDVINKTLQTISFGPKR